MSGRLNKIREWNNRNVWNDPYLTGQDQLSHKLPKVYIMEHDSKQETDPVEEVVEHIHVVIPVVGAVLIFMLAFIAITMT